MKVRIPLVPHTSDGEPCPTPVVRLKVRDRYGTIAELRFRVDTQADVTTMPITLVDKEAISFTRTRPGTSRGIAGRIKKYRGRIAVVIAGRDHDWPCDFTEPAIDPETQQPLADLPPVLGRAGFLDDYALTIDSGYMILTRLSPLRRWWRRRVHAVWHRLGLVHPPEKPL